jgi:peptide/nickel transport system substrate-binding protein
MELSPHGEAAHVSRRTLLKFGGLAGGVLLVGSSLSACSPPKSAAKTSSATPVKGGTLRLGVPGSTSDSLDPHHNQAAVTDLMRVAQLYEPLTALKPDSSVEFRLAESMTPNATADEWVVKLRSGVKMHDGSTFGADDVIASVTRMLDPKTASRGASLLSFMKAGGMTKVDDVTVKFTLLRPYGPFKEIWATWYLLMAKKGFDPKNPVGTGPFKFKSFTAGQSSTFTRFDEYWGGAAHVDAVQIIDFSDNTAALNALRGAQIDMCYAVPLASAASLKSAPNIKVLDSKTSMYIPIVMRTDQAPFNDVRVRTAMRLIADREELVSVALNGYGSVANDWIGRYNTAGDPDLPQRKQDIAQAKALLAAAGQSNLTVELATTNGTDGMVQAAQVFAEQAKKAGVTINVKNLDVSAFLAKYTEWTMAMDFYAEPYINLVPTTLLPGGAGNASHWNDKEFEALALKTFAQSDDHERGVLENDMKKIEYERGGNIVWGWADVLNAYRDSVHGVVQDTTGDALFRLHDMWLS